MPDVGGERERSAPRRALNARTSHVARILREMLQLRFDLDPAKLETLYLAGVVWYGSLMLAQTERRHDPDSNWIAQNLSCIG